MFTENVLRKWANKVETDKIWTIVKVYFDALYIEKHTYQDDMGVTKSGFESANSFGELKSPPPAII